MKRVVWSGSLIAALVVSPSPAWTTEGGAGEEPAPALAAAPEPEAALAAEAAADDALAAEAAPDDALADEVVDIEQRLPPGAVHVVREDELARFERDDPHKILLSVPGVYVRTEDGYGLRPNIGMRGSGTDRSAKIAIMEDGVLSAPAPYSAPAAYYFPLMTRMQRVEVTKGPSTIIYGPNTVGGALSMWSREVPLDREITLDVAGGSDLYGKLHGSWGETFGRLGFLVEGVKLHSDGFKRLDGGGGTGFDKHDVTVKGRLRSRPGRVFHQLDLKLNYSDEVSSETYTGLSDADFAADPYRRYAGSALDRFEGRRFQTQASHKLLVDADFTLLTTAYRADFSRAWRKLNGFVDGPDVASVLAHPETAQNQVFYGILTGNDSTDPSEALVIGTNDRTFVSQGVQTVASWNLGWWGLPQTLEVGTRLHHDSADRYHTEEAYMMNAGTMVREGSAQAVTFDALGSAFAWASHVRHQLRLGDLEITAGTRVEVVRTAWYQQGSPDDGTTEVSTAVLPGAGVVYWLQPSVALLAGVHRGYVPSSPGAGASATAEASVNYEVGGRFASGGVRGEAIGFFSDYQHLRGDCTFSAQCEGEMLDDEFDGGAVHVWGLEAHVAGAPELGRLRFPLAATYTYTRSKFQTSFNSKYPEWGVVEAGDELAYLPAHQLALEAGVGGKTWEVALAGRHLSAARDSAGQGPTPADERIDATWRFDAAVHADLGGWGAAYLTVDNVLDHASIVSRRPYGARPGAPRLVVLGYKQAF